MGDHEQCEEVGGSLKQRSRRGGWLARRRSSPVARGDWTRQNIWMLASHGAKVAIADLNLPGATTLADPFNAKMGAGTGIALLLQMTVEEGWTPIIDAAALATGYAAALPQRAS